VDRTVEPTASIEEPLRHRGELKMSAEEVYEAAMTLPDESKALLTERLVAYLETHIDPEIERAHLEVARRRDDEILSGQVETLDGETVMARARKIVGR
jgi:hypothetical protein